MSKKLAKYEVDARVYYVDINTKQANIKGVGVQMQAFNKGNAKKRAYKHLMTLKDVDKVEILGARLLKA